MVDGSPHNLRRKILLAASPSAGECIREIAQFAQQHEWHLVTDMLFTGAYPLTWKGDGILALVAYQSDILARIHRSGIPCVGITLSDEPAHLPRVEVDNGEIGRIAANFFLKRGYRSFAWAPFIDDKLNRERYSSFRENLRLHGHSCRSLPPRHVRVGSCWQHDWPDRRQALVEELKCLPHATAILASNDRVGSDIVDGCIDAGLSVPEDIAVLGLGNDLAVCESAGVPLSSVDLDLKALVRRAVSTLELMMDGVRLPPQILRTSPNGVVSRISTDIVSVANPCVSSALKYISECYADPRLGVAHVSHAVGVSPRHLQKLMQREIGSTVVGRIIRTRMLAAARLLRAHPKAKSSDIAELVGLSGAGIFNRYFRRFFGTTPGARRAWNGQAPSPAMAPRIAS